METAAVARVARERGVPLAAFRVVLDEANDAIPGVGDLIDPETGELRSGAALRWMLRPRSWRAAWHLGGCGRVAAASLRAACGRLATAS